MCIQQLLCHLLGQPLMAGEMDNSIRDPFLFGRRHFVQKRNQNPFLHEIQA